MKPFLRVCTDALTARALPFLAALSRPVSAEIFLMSAGPRPRRRGGQTLLSFRSVTFSSGFRLPIEIRQSGVPALIGGLNITRSSCDDDLVDHLLPRDVDITNHSRPSPR